MDVGSATTQTSPEPAKPFGANTCAVNPWPKLPVFFDADVLVMRVCLLSHIIYM